MQLEQTSAMITIMKKAHIIGISGVAMSATAKLLQDTGWNVSGSDDSYYPPASDYVKKLHIQLKTGYDPKNIPDDTELIIMGRNAQLNPKTNKEVQAAIASKIPIQSYPQTLYTLTKKRERVVIAGSYGKSTVTSLISWVLLHANRDPGYFIGAYPEDIEYTSHLGTHSVFIMEGDEYPTAHDDNRAKFLHYDPHTVLLTAVDHDHVNIYPTHQDYQKPFIELLEKMPTNGLLVACADNQGVCEIQNKTHARIVTYGIHHKAQWSAKNIAYGEVTTFDLCKNNHSVTTLSTTLLGTHNVQNIVGASALLLEKELVTPNELQASIRAFSGIKRRLNRITSDTAIPAYEGFGTSYEKARSAIEAIKLHYPDKKILILFEPHTFSWRNRNALHWYDTVFTEAENVLVFHPAEQGADTHKQLSQEEIVQRIKQSGTKAKEITTQNDIYIQLSRILTDDTVLLILTSGNLNGALDTLPQWLNERKKTMA